MTVGPGKYDDQATAAMKATGASGVVLIVFGGYLGQGFSVQATWDITKDLPAVLRSIAGQIEEDASKIKPEGRDGC